MSERGFTLLEVLAAIGLLILLAGLVVYVWDTSGMRDLGERQVCLTQLDKVSGQIQTWAKTTSPTNPGGEHSLCTSIKDMVDKYNKQCAMPIGALPVPTCD